MEHDADLRCQSYKTNSSSVGRQQHCTRVSVRGNKNTPLKQKHTSQVATGPSLPVAKEEQKHMLCTCLAYEKKNRHHINRETKRQMQDGC